MRRILLVSLLLSACGPRRGPGETPGCGIAALAGPSALLEAFTVPGQTLSVPPNRLPERTVARLAAGPVFPALVGRSDSGLVVGIEGALPANTVPAFGVLVVQRGGAVRGVMLYEVPPIEGAPRLGMVSVGGKSLPLIGIELDLVALQDARCPMFPDPVSP